MNTLHLSIITIAIIGFVTLSSAFGNDSTSDNQWHKYYQLGKFTDSNPPKADQIFIYQYRVINGTVIEFNGKGGAFMAKIQGNSNALFEIKIPRNFPYTDQLENGPRYGDTSPLFLMDNPDFGTSQKDFANTKTLNPVNKTSDCFFTYSIPFSGNHKIEFAWMYLASGGFPAHGGIIPQYCNEQTIAGDIPPIQQIKIGVDLDHVTCAEGLKLLIKWLEGSPGCVKPQTAQNLVDRGWGKIK